MTAAVLLAVLCAVLAVALVAYVARRDGDHHRSYRPLTHDLRVWEVESPREVEHD